MALWKMGSGPEGERTAWNGLVDAVKRLLPLRKLTVAPPLALTRVGGIPCISISLPPTTTGMKYGKAYDNIAAGTVGPVKFWEGPQGEEEEADEPTDVFSRHLAIPTGREVYVAWIGEGWEVVDLIPYPCQDLRRPELLDGWNADEPQLLKHVPATEPVGDEPGEPGCFAWIGEDDDCPEGG